MVSFQISQGNFRESFWVFRFAGVYKGIVNSIGGNIFKEVIIPWLPQGRSLLL